MKRKFVVGLFGSLIGLPMLLIVLSAAGTAGAGSAEVRADVSHANAVASATLTSTFTYQGRLVNSGSPVSSTCDFQFSLYDALSAGNRVGITQTVGSVSVSRGLFTALLNAGNEFGDTAFNGDARWLSIGVRCPAGGGGYASLSPLQPLTSLPFALPGLRTFPNATSPNIVGGYSGNFISSTVVGGVIGGGGYSGYPNRAQANFATVGGGQGNTASGYAATLGGGSGDTASGGYATVGGGNGNTASNIYATVGGGNNNTASGDGATVTGGYYNTASGDGATVIGGADNTASGGVSFAAGSNANANGDGCFAWGDHSTSDGIFCNGNNLWSIRSTGGFYFYPGNNAFCSLTDATGWQCTTLSDRNAKQDFVAVNPREVLNQVAALPIKTWAYKDDATQIQHIGPTAQDFYAAFNVGADDKHINPVDSEGVALAAIQGLYQQNQEMKAQIEALQNQAAPPVSFNWFNLIGLIAFVICGLTLFKVRRQLKQAGRS